MPYWQSFIFGLRLLTACRQSPRRPCNPLPPLTHALCLGSSTTVLNSVSCNSMLLLTGPNMAGKSTVLRTVAATSLLGAAGLMAPCESGRIPYLDAFILRTFSQDR